MRMKSISRSLMSGRYSCCVLNSSPIASGMLVCWRSRRKCSFSSGGNGSSRKNSRYGSSALHRLMPWLSVTRSCTSCSSSTSSPSFVRRCSNSFGSMRHVRRRLPDRARVGRPDGLVLRRRRRRRTVSARAVAGVAGRAAPARARGGSRPPCPCARWPRPRRSVRAAGVVVAVGAVPHLAAEQLIERQAGALALDVPQRDVDAAHRVEEHRPVAPVGADVARLPDVFDLVDVAADEERLQVLLERGLHDQRALRERRAAPADEARLGRLDLHDDEADAVRRGEDRLDVADLHRRRAAHGLREHRGGGRREALGQRRPSAPDGSNDAPPAMEIDVMASRRFIG